MATLPRATVTIDDSSGALSTGEGFCVVMAPVGTAADSVPRVYSNAKSILERHDYAPGVSYSGEHFEQTGKPIIFIGMPIAAAGTVGSNDDTGLAMGTSVITVTGTPLEETQCELVFVDDGTIGTDSISFDFTADGGETWRRVKMGTADTYEPPFLGFTINFAAGTVVAEESYSFRTSAPMYDDAGVVAARAALAAQQKLSRTWMLIGEASEALCEDVVDEVNSYETENQRFTLARVAIKDRSPLAKKSKIGGQTLTFATAGDTITRSAGSFVADGFEVGDSVLIDGTASNDGTKTITILTPTVMTVSQNLTDEGPINSDIVDMDQVLTMSDWMAASDAAYADLAGEARIDVSAGRARQRCPITGWKFRRPAQWHVSLREYQHAENVATWRKSDGPLGNCDMTDENGTVVEFDEAYDGGALAARFTCLRTWSNGPRGAFVAMSLTRAEEGKRLGFSHNRQVTDIACTVVQKMTEDAAIGQDLILNDDGTATDDSLAVIEERVNSALEAALLQAFKEGQKASKAVWRASREDDFSLEDATLTGQLILVLKGTIVVVDTTVRVS